MSGDFICTTDVITLKPLTDANSKFFLAILNSKICGGYIKSKNVNLDRNVFPKINTNTLEDFPVPNFDTVDAVLRSEIIEMVDKIERLSLSADRESNPTAAEIDFLEDNLNEILYSLYGLNVEDIAIIEGASHG